MNDEARWIEELGNLRQRLAEVEAEMALQKERDLATAVLDTSGSLIVVLDREGRIVRFNHACERATGYSFDEVQGKYVWDIFLIPEEIEAVKAVFEGIVARDFPNEHENYWVARDGSRRLIAWSNTALLDHEGTVEYVIGTGIDVTERRKAEEALRTSELQYRTTLDSMRDPIHVVGADLNFVLYNIALQKWLEEIGLEQVAVGQSVFEAFPFLPDKVRDEYLCVLDTGKVVITEERTQIGDQEYITETRKIPVFEQGEVVQIVTVIHDITDRKRAEEAVRESEARYRSLVETSPDAITLTDLDGRIIMVNQQAVQMHGCESAEELTVKSAFDLIAPEDRPRAMANAQKTLETGTVQGVEYTMLRKDGSRFPAELSASLIVDTRGKPQAFIGVVRDITERKRLEEQFLQAQKMETMGRLAGGVAHDFNNLLTAIEGYAGLVRSALRPGDPVRKDIEQVLWATDRAAALTSQLLAFSRRQVIQPAIIDLNDLVLEMDKMLRRLIGENIELVVEPTSEPCLVEVDPGQIEQALVNLVVNARDAMPEGGTLTIETGSVVLDEDYARQHVGVEPGSFVVLSISDTGVGMTEEVQAHIFEPFFTTKEVGSGTGLGLATVYGIVKQHQGHIWVDSEPDRGTAFKVHLPQAEGEVAPLPRRDEVEALPSGKETVLVVEDDLAVRSLIVQVLRAQGYTVLEAADGDQAVRVARRYRGKVHLLLTDVVMPRMDGKALSSLLCDVYPDLKVLYISGHAANVVARHGVLLEGVAFLAKPFSAEVLAGKVREVLDAPQEGGD